MTELSTSDTQIAVIDSSDYSSFETPLQQIIRNLLTGDADGVTTAVDPEDILVVVRTNAAGQKTVSALEQLGIPAHQSGDSDIEGTLGGAILGLLELATSRAHFDEHAAEPESDVMPLLDTGPTLTNQASVGDQADGLAQVLHTLYGLPSDSGYQILDGGTRIGKQPYPFLKAVAAGEASLSLDGMASTDVRERVTEFVTDVETLADQASHRSLVGAIRRTLIYLGLDAVSARSPSLQAIQETAGSVGLEAHPPQCSVTALRNLRAQVSMPTSETGVTVSTLHKAKGSEETVVVMPDLAPDNWESWHSATQLRHIVQGARDFSESATESVTARKTNNQRRLAYVGITRPRDLLVMIGHGRTGTAASPSVPDVDDYLKETIETTRMTGVFDIWAELQAELPAEAATWQPPDETPESLATLGQTVGEMTDLLELLEATREAAEVTDPDVDVTTIDRTGAPNARLDRSYSFTTVSAAADCQRKALLETVLDAPGIRESSPEAAGEGPSRRMVGILAHGAAEHEWPSSAVQRDWLDRVERVAESEHCTDAETIETAKDCIRTLFNLGVHERDIVATEVPFEITIADREITGYVDAIERTDEGLRPVDLKTGAHEPNHLQLASYQLALANDDQLRNRWPDATILPGAFIKIHPDNNGVQVYDRADDRGDLLELSAAHARPHVETLSAVSFDSYTPGAHCTGCPYSYLGCGSESETPSTTVEQPDTNA